MPTSILSGAQIRGFASIGTILICQPDSAGGPGAELVLAEHCGSNMEQGGEGTVTQRFPSLVFAGMVPVTVECTPPPSLFAVNNRGAISTA